MILPPRPRFSQSFTNRLHEWTTKAITYVRGPRPKVDLAGTYEDRTCIKGMLIDRKIYPLAPVPLLNLDLHLAGKHIIAPIESNIIKATRRLTSPWLFAILVAAYIIGFAFLSRAQSFLTPAEAFVGCTSAHWLANDNCGQDGRACGPFDSTSFDFRCPSQCENVILQNPRTVGNQQIAFKPLLVGGGDDNRTYRGDSFICSAAIQA